MRGCRCTPQGSVSMAMLLLLWLCDVGTAAVTAARACPAAICVTRSSYLTSLKGVPQGCEMGRDMSSSSSSIRRLSAKLPGEGKGTRDGNFRMRWQVLVFESVLVVYKFAELCLTHTYVFMIFSNLGVICFKTKQKVPNIILLSVQTLPSSRWKIISPCLH